MKLKNIKRIIQDGKLYDVEKTCKNPDGDKIVITYCDDGKSRQLEIPIRALSKIGKMENYNILSKSPLWPDHLQLHGWLFELREYDPGVVVKQQRKEAGTWKQKRKQELWQA